MTTVIKNITITLLLLAAAGAAAQNAAGEKKAVVEGTLFYGIAGNHKRLIEAITNLKIKPDEEGKYTFPLSSGIFYDVLDRQVCVYRKKAVVYVAQNRISKILFEYYQFGMDNKVREIKTFTHTAIDSDDLSSLQIDYIANTGEKQSYKAGDLTQRQSQREIIGQYANYLTSLIFTMELFKQKAARLQSLKIERTIQLGD